MSSPTNPRVADHPIEPIFLERWSPRAFTGEGISERTLRTMFEAARWAPSSYNSQPWRFIYARRDNAHWDKLLGLLNEFNQSWAKTASAIVFIASAEQMHVTGKEETVPSYSHSFDAGAAWGYMALQAAYMGWAAHAMVGVDFERAYKELEVPKGYRIEVAVAIGRKGPTDLLPEGLQAREVPSDRKKLTEIANEGQF